MLKFAIALGIISVTAGAISCAFAELPTVAPPHDSVMKKELDGNSFVQQAALNSMQEIELSKLVLDKSQNDRLREFATTIIANSTASLAGLRAIANYNKIGMPERLDAERRQLIDQTRQLRDRGFDETYVNLIQKVHDTTVGLYSNAEGQANFHSELKSFAKRQLPTLQEDQRKAHALFPTSPTSAIPPSQ